MSEGGRRLYTDKDIIKLHQILSLKSLGFSIDEIKNRLTSIDTPDEVAAARYGKTPPRAEVFAFVMPVFYL